MKKIQWNTTNGKNFRTLMAKYHDARHALNDYICKKSVIVTGLKQAIDMDLEDILKLEKGENEGILRTLDEVKASYTVNTVNLTTAQEDLKVAREKCAKATEKAESLVTDDLYDAYNTDDFATAIATWLVANGFDDADAENCQRFTTFVGLRDLGAKAAFKAGKLTAGKNKKAFTRTFLGAFADLLQDEGIINAYKYTFVAPSKKNK
jgi:hypothetical protein